MGMYVPLFNITISNNYFNSSVWGGLEFVANSATQRMFDAAGLVMKATSSGVQLLRDSEKDVVLQCYANDGAGRLRFSFNVFIKDRSFRNYTDFPTLDADSVLLFDNLRFSHFLLDDTFRISSTEYVSIDDASNLAAGVRTGLVDVADQSLRPNFIVSISLDFADLTSDIQRTFLVPFAPRQSYWQYFLLGAMNKENLFISDVESAVEFEPRENAIVYGNKEARVYRSKSTLPILERSPYRFQLKENGYGTGRVLIKRLPVASDKLSLEVVDGETVLVANNYVSY